MCVLISLRDCNRVWLWNYNRFRVLHAVDSVNVKHVKQLFSIVIITIEKSKAILYHSDISKRYFLVWHLKIVFNFVHELKQRGSEVTGWHWQLVDSDVTEGVITTQSNWIKFRLHIYMFHIFIKNWVLIYFQSKLAGLTSPVVKRISLLVRTIQPKAILLK